MGRGPPKDKTFNKENYEAKLASSSWFFFFPEVLSVITKVQIVQIRERNKKGVR